MGFSSWLYTDSRKNLRVKIVHPGGHAELHERPVLASEILGRNPKCCVAHPNVFKQPWAIVQPDTMLMPGQKFYIVPISTIRKLQMVSLKHPSSRIEEAHHPATSQSVVGHQGGEEDGFFSPCWNSTPKMDPACLKSSGDSKDDTNGSSSCFTCIVKRRTNKDTNKDARRRETKYLGSSGSCEANKCSSPKKLASLDYWQPDLQSVNEE